MSAHRLARASLVALCLAATLGGCSKSTTANDTATAAPQSDGATASPQSDGATASPEGDSGGTATSPVASATVAPSPVASATAATVRFDDISGVNGRDQIVGFATLGAIDPTSGSFRPGTPVKRRDFIRWLVKANNVLWADSPAKLVKLADTTETSSFPDVANTDPDFPYIQGMQDAGYSVGFPDKRFRPDDPLTREQMFAIKNVFDRGTVDPGLAKGVDFARNTAMAPWKDKADISKTYVPGIATGEGGGATNFALVYGSSSLFRPKVAVTRAQAVVAMSVIGDHTFYGTGRRTLQQALAAASPTP